VTIFDLISVIGRVFRRSRIKVKDEDSVRGEIRLHDPAWSPHSGNTSLLCEDNAIICTCLWTIHITITRTNTAPTKLVYHGF
jgi:hypothetical protein